MPTYEVQAPDGRRLKIEGPTPPTEAELDDIFAAVATPQQADFRTEVRASDGVAQESGPIGRFASSFARTVLPSTTPSDYIEGPLYAAQHPIESAKLVGGALVGAHQATGEKALEHGRAALGGELASIPKAIGYGAAAALPLIGPAIASGVEQMGEGDIAGGLGTLSGIAAPVGVNKLRPQMRPLTASIGERVAAKLSQMSADRLTNVIVPKVGPNKVRFGNRAAEIAPRLAREEGLGAATREGLQNKVETKLAESEAALDSAANARNPKKVYSTKPILAELRSRVGRRTAPTARAGNVKAGSDVVPAPNRARVAQIEQAIDEIKQLGTYASYEALRRIRESYDAPAKAVYSPSMTADYLARSGEKMGAADVTGVLRETLAKADPATAEANANYALYKSAADVLRATEETQRTRPTVGRKMLTSAITGSMGTAVSPGIGTAIGIALGPLVDEALNAGLTTKIATARLLAHYADAIRANQPKRANTLLSQIRTVTKRGSVGAGRTQVGAQSVPQAAEGQNPERQYAR